MQAAALNHFAGRRGQFITIKPADAVAAAQLARERASADLLIFQRYVEKPGDNAGELKREREGERGRE